MTQCEYYYGAGRRCQFEAVKTIVATDPFTIMVIAASSVNVCQKHSDEYDQLVAKDIQDKGY